LSAPLLGERVGALRWTAIVAGFAGVLVVTRPGAATFQTASGLALAATTLYALVMISARWIDQRDSARTVMLYLTLSAALLSSFAVLTPWPEPRASDALLFLTMAVAGTLGITLITQAFRMAPAAIVAPFDYTALLWAGALGWLVWGDVPDVLTSCGAAVIVASGLWLVLHERRGGRGAQALITGRCAGSVNNGRTGLKSSVRGSLSGHSRRGARSMGQSGIEPSHIAGTVIVSWMGGFSDVLVLTPRLSPRCASRSKGNSWDSAVCLLIAIFLRIGAE
jgi:uncharacterized membrane protein